MIHNELLWLIVILGLITYATRFGGHLILSYFKIIPPRIEAALDAVPMAVMSALVMPAALLSGWPEFIAASIAVFISLRFSILTVAIIATGSLAVIRFLFL